MMVHRRLAWSAWLPLAHLGLTPSEIEQLQRIRQRIAARRIQRTARVFLRRVRHARAVADASARAQRAAQRLQEHAALVVQRFWRGHRARRRCAALREARARERRVRAVERVRRMCAAVRIQRAWRMHRKRRRAQLAACAACPGGGGTAGAPGAAVGGEYGDGHVRAAVRIQAVVRGWLWRRSVRLWWVRSVRELRERRTAKAAWERRRAFMKASMPLQQQVCERGSSLDGLCGFVHTVDTGLPGFKYVVKAVIPVKSQDSGHIIDPIVSPMGKW